MRRLLFIPLLLLLCSSAFGQTPLQIAEDAPWTHRFRTTSTPAAGSGVTSFFTTDLAPTRPFSGSGRFFTTWTTTNSPSPGAYGPLAYCNDTRNPSQGLLAWIDRNAGNANLDAITAYNSSTGATTRTSLISTAITFVSGAQLVLVVDWDQAGANLGRATLFYNNTIVGSVQDISAYQSYRNNSKHAIFSTVAVTPRSVVYDYGKIGLGTDLLAGWDFTSGWALLGCTVTNATTVTATGIESDVTKTVGSTGVLYKGTATATMQQGTLSVRDSGHTSTYFTATSGVAGVGYFYMPAGTTWSLINYSTANGKTMQVTDQHFWGVQ